nr:prostaglandin E synthase 3 like protein [Lepeophtheirus salmonis salmonis]
MSSSKCPPKVIWAQTAAKVLVTVCLEDCKDPTVNVEEKKLFFSGVGGKDKSEYEVTMELFDEVVPEETTKLFLDRVIEITLQKKDVNKGYWTRLIQDKKRQHWLSLDFLKWRGESDEDSEADLDVNLDGLAGMQGMQGMQENISSGSVQEIMKMHPDLNDLDQSDSGEDDEEDIPGLMN